MFCPYISNGDVVYLDDALFRAIMVVREKEKEEGGRKGGKRMSTRIRVFHLLAELLVVIDYCLYLTFWKLFSFFVM